MTAITFLLRRIYAALFSGVLFPTQLLKEYGGPAIGSVSRVLPATYGINGVRAVLIERLGLRDVQEPLITLVFSSRCCFPFSLWVFGRAVRRAKREGSLIQY